MITRNRREDKRLETEENINCDDRILESKKTKTHAKSQRTSTDRIGTGIHNNYTCIPMIHTMSVLN